VQLDHATLHRRLGVRHLRSRHRPCVCAGDHQKLGGRAMGRILLGVIIGVVLVIWLLASCVGAIF
jgi:hypothetical protein